MTTALLTTAHGTVDDLDDLPAFLAVIRRGHAAPPELVAEVRRRYEAIGGQSPLDATCREVTRRLGERLGMKAAFASRLWRPSPREVLGTLAAGGVTRVVVVPLAQHSAPLYVDAVRQAAREVPGIAEVVGPGNWGREPALTQAFAKALDAALGPPSPDDATTKVLFTAHSLPMAVVRGGDPYESEVRASAAAVVRAIGRPLPPHEVIFQSQGASGGEWLGPDVKSALDRLKSEGVRRVVFAPIGFLADHVEVLYDLDIEARGWAEARGMVYARTESQNASDGLVDALVAVVERVLSG